MNEFEGEAASTGDTLRYCASLAQPYRRFLLAGAGFLILAVVVSDVATPLVFATVLDKIATVHTGTALWPRFGNLIIVYAVLIIAGQFAYRMCGWLEWEGCLRTFANGIHRSFDRLLSLGYRWHIDHPSGEVASSLSSFSWALADGIDTLHWGVLRNAVVVLSAAVVLGVVAWPVAVVLVLLTAAFVIVVIKRSAPVTQASRRFSTPPIPRPRARPRTSSATSLPSWWARARRPSRRGSRTCSGLRWPPTSTHERSSP